MTIQEMVNYLNSRNCHDLLFYKLEELADQDNTKDATNYIQNHFNCNYETAEQVFIEYKNKFI